MHLSRRNSILRLLLFAFAILVVIPPRSVSAKPKSVSPALGHVSPGSAMSERFLSRRADGAVMVSVMIQGDVAPGLLRARGIEVNTVAGGWMTAHCPLGLLGALLEVPGIERVEVAERCEPSLDVSVIDAGVSSVRTVGPTDITGQTGEGVVVGLVDSGVDLGHADMRRPDGHTRIITLWDQTAPAGPPPPGFTYGTEWDSTAINNGTATEVDTDGHGTHVISTAAGNGRATGNGQPANTFVGVAPKADIIAVKTTYTTTDIADGVEYIFNKAASLGKKAVVNLSLGTQAGPHDGTYVFDTLIDALTGPGKIVVASAGNKQQDDMHGRVDVAQGGAATMTLNVPTYAKNPGTVNDYMVFTGWYPGIDQISITITSPNGHTLGPIVQGTTQSLSSVDGTINAFNGTTVPTNGDNEIYVEIYDETSARTPEPGTWTFTFTGNNVTDPGRVDMYLYSVQLGSAGVVAKWVQGLAPYGVIGSPGSADSVITAAAHTTKDCWTSVNGNSYCWDPQPTLSDIAPFSSQGPLRDGTQKPDLSAPGDGVAAARSTASSLQIELVVPDNVHIMLAGTSMSSPHVAGTVGLLLAQPTWAGASPSAIKNRLRATARADAFTGSVPNAAWGYGKLNAAAALAPVVTMHVIHPEKGFNMPPGKPDSLTVTVAGATADSITFDLSTNGGASYSVPLGVLYGVTPGPPHALSFVPDPSWSTPQAKIRGTGRAGATTFTGFSDSLFSIDTPTAVATVEHPVSAPRFALEENRPNPFNPVTKIAYEIPRAGPVTLRVYTVQGALVRTLVDAPLGAGPHTAVWDGRDDRGRAVGSGVYVSRLESAGKQLARKMSLLK